MPKLTKIQINGVGYDIEDANAVDEINYIKSAFDTSYEAIGLDFVHENAFYSCDGQIITYNAINRTDFIDVSNYRSISISGTAFYQTCVIALFDKDKNFVRAYPDHSVYEDVDEDIKVEGFKYVVVNDVTPQGLATPSLYGEKGLILQKWHGKKWCCVGDSLTEINSRTTKHYFDYVKEETGIDIYNMGVSGSGYAKHQDIGKAFYQRIQNVPTDADVVTIFGSGNDGSAELEIGLPTDTGTNTLCGCINTTIDNLYTVLPTVPLGIVSPTPWSWEIPEDENCFMYKYSNALKAICERRGIPFLDMFRLSAFRTMKDGAVNEETHDLLFSNDPVGNCTHPNELGHKLIAPKFKAFLESLII